MRIAIDADSNRPFSVLFSCLTSRLRYDRISKIIKELI